MPRFWVWGMVVSSVEEQPHHGHHGGHHDDIHEYLLGWLTGAWTIRPVPA
jgi:hypothetical protein